MFIKDAFRKAEVPVVAADGRSATMYPVKIAIRVESESEVAAGIVMASIEKFGLDKNLYVLAG